MISRGLKKKPATSPPKPSNIKKKSKSKPKSKQKNKKFNAKDFLEALIDLQNTNCSTNKKKRNTTRDISSALTVATPILEKTISASKIRSKSSFSQYRKKCNGTLKEPMTINLCAIITEEDNVQYTEKTARSSHQDRENQKNELNSMIENSNKRKNENSCAIKIQRAWRNYQTYKMVHQIYLRERRLKQLNNRKSLSPNSNTLHIKIKKPDFEKTLRIKKQHAIKKEERKQQQFSQTQKIIKERYGEGSNDGLSKQHNSPIEQFISFQSQQGSNRDELIVLQKLKERQAQMLKEVIEMIEREGNDDDAKQQLIKKLIEKCENNKKILEKDFNAELESFKLESEPKISCNQKEEGRKVEEIDKNDLKNSNNRSLLSIKSSQKSSLSQSFDHENLGDEVEEIKIFQQRLKYIRQQKIKKLEVVDDDVLESRITNSEAIKKKERIYNQFQTQKKQIMKNKKNFLFSLAKLKKCAIKCQKFGLQQSLSLKKIRKSFSAGSTVIKEVLQDIKMLDILDKQDDDAMCKWLFKRQQGGQSTQNSKPLTTTPILQLPSPNKASESEQQLIEKNNNTEVMKEYSEEIQEMIEKDLIEEFVTSVFLEPGLFEYFKPYVEQIYQFRKVTDTEICQFINIISKYLPDEKIMMNRVNQKINPTSLQILKIIRDLDYETDEYQLIIPEECFKKYRASIEKEFQESNPFKEIDSKELSIKVKNIEIAQKVYQLEIQKREKMRKYRNFQRDLKIMYMKSVFNCLNQFLIELKSSNAFMNGRSSIGPGQLTLALKQYNENYGKSDYLNLFTQVQSRLSLLINNKCSIPSFKNYYDIQQFQKQVMKQIQIDSNQNEFKWVNYMDEVLEIWQDLSTSIVEQTISEACIDIIPFFQ